MCGRFALFCRVAALAHHFDMTHPPNLAANYNIAPMSQLLGCYQLGCLGMYVWGLRPAWLPASRKGFTNARVETVLAKPTFRQAITHGRILVPMTGYYEWQLIQGKKQPFYIHQPETELFSVAGIVSNNTCAILTCDSGASTQAIHARMPLMIPRSHYNIWLSEGATTQCLSQLCTLSQKKVLAFYPVTSKMNAPTFNSEKCIAKIHNKDIAFL